VGRTRVADGAVAMRLTIGGKIFGVTVTLIVLMWIVCVIVARLDLVVAERLVLVADGFQPLNDEVIDYRRASLRRQMRLAKLMRLLDAEPRKPQAIAVERKAFDEEAITARRHLDGARERVKKLLSVELRERERDELVRLQVTLEELLARSIDNLDLARKLVDATEKRDAVAITELAPMSAKAESDMLRAGLNNVGSARELLRHMVMEVVREQGQSVRLSYVIGALAAALGLIFSVLVIRGLVRPVGNLMRGVHEVQTGNLGVHIDVQSTDEIGALTTSFNQMVVELRAKETLKDTFGKYIDPRVVETLLAQGPEAAAGRREVMTVFFSDLVGFTSISERLTPSGLVNVMNRYLSMMSAPIRAHQGLIDKYIGDAIMAFWGPPFTSREEHARLACLAALEQLQALTEFRGALPELMGMRKGIPDVDFRIGIATGDVVVGNIGSETTRAYTVLGDTVNLASRLEGANKQYGTRILISEEVERMSRDAVETREIDLIAVKGKTDPIRVFELLALKGKLDPERARVREPFERGLEAYRKQDWNAAVEQFRRCHETLPGDGPSTVYLERVEMLAKTPPEPGWDGVWRLTSK
jgi:class 3 adenylate cyclase